jgi:NAD(P)-dependent dehydrogenase (short-subunit alcohol dehydrogenase family)
MQLKEVNAIVTGGASGLGRAVANRIVHAGGRVAIFDLSVPQGSAAATALGRSAAFFAVDVSDETAVDSAVNQAKAAMGSINAAINCAGIATPGRLVGRNGPMAGSSFRKMIEINLLGTVLVAKAAAVAMQGNSPNAQGERGVIVMTASVAAFDGQIGQIAYSASLRRP